ncbi:hypothetical protein LCGC14_1387140, partial [marine sediment metagenome]
CLLGEIQALTGKANKIYAVIRASLLEEEAKVLLAKKDKRLVQL